MMKGGLRRKRLWLICGTLLILVPLFVTFYKMESQPRYEGKTADYWVKQYKRRQNIIYGLAVGPISSHTFHDVEMLKKSSDVFNQADAEFLIAAFDKTETVFDAFVRFWGPNPTFATGE